MATTINTLPIIAVGLLLGGIFGFVSERTRFCTMGAVADWSIGNFARMAMWLWAIAIATVGVAVLQWQFHFDANATLYAQPRLLWLSHLVGGALFGVGMTLAGGCVARSLVRLGGGNLKALIVVGVTAISAYATMKGILSVPRRAGLEPFFWQFSQPPLLPEMIANQVGIAPHLVSLLMATLLAMVLAGVCWRNPTFRTTPYWLGATIIGVLVVVGFWTTGVFGFLPEHPDTLEPTFMGTNSARPESFSMLAPIAYGLELLMLWSDQSRVMTFGIALALAMPIGAAISALIARKFHWEGFRETKDLNRHLIGAVLMGFGGVCAVGCSLGQGVSGISTLALGSILTTLSMVGGCWITVRYLARNL